MSHKLKLIGFIPLLAVCFALLPKAQALSPLPDGGYPGVNVAEGTNALFSLTTGTANTAIGVNTLFHNSDGSSNTAVGDAALVSNTHGNSNTATGFRALFKNTTGPSNTAVGALALFSSTGLTGYNTAIGFAALQNNISGSDNVALGRDAGINHSTGDDNIYIRNDGLANEVGTIRIGTQIVHSSTYIAGIANTTLTTNTAPVVVTPLRANWDMRWPLLRSASRTTLNQWQRQVKQSFR